MGTKQYDLPVAEMARQYGTGDTMEQIGRRYGVSGSTVWSRFREVGVRMRGGNTANLLVAPAKRRRRGRRSFRSGGYEDATGRDGCPYAVHRACWEAHHGPIPDGCVIHHHNGDVSDNRIENLACMSNGEHTRLHHQLRSS